MPGTEGALVSGAYGLNDIPSALLKFDKDKDYAGMILYIQREIASFTFLVREKLPRVQVSSHEPTLPEITERSYKFNLTDNGPSGASGVMIQVVNFSDTDAKNFQKNDFLTVDGVYFNGTATWTTTFSATSGPKEVVRVLDVDVEGSGGASKTKVTIQRGWGGDGTGTPAQITTTMTLVLTTSAASEASRSRKSIGKNLVTDSNYIQLLREPYEATDFEMDEDLFYKERPEQINANLASLLLTKKMEFMAWQGRKAKVPDTTSGKLLYTSGGIMEFIPRDADHHKNFGSIVTATGLNTLFKDVALLGGTEERWFFVGYSLATAIANAFDNKIKFNEELADVYRLKVPVIESSVGLRINIVPSFALTELGYDWEGWCLDFGSPDAPFFQYMFMEDIYINTGRDGKGIQANDEFTRKEEFVAKIGLIRRASQYQVHVYGVTQTS